MLTKKDYIVAANIIRGYIEQGMPQDVVDIAEEAFIQFFEQNGNPRFDKDRFRDYCRK